MVSLGQVKAAAARLAHEDELTMECTYISPCAKGWDQVAALLGPVLEAVESTCLGTAQSIADDGAMFHPQIFAKLQQFNWSSEAEESVKFLLAGCACLLLAEPRRSFSHAETTLLTTVVQEIVQKSASLKHHTRMIQSLPHSSNKKARQLVASMQRVLTSRLDLAAHVRSLPLSFSS